MSWPVAPWITAATVATRAWMLKLAVTCWVVWLRMKSVPVVASKLQLLFVSKQKVSLVPAAMLGTV